MKLVKLIRNETTPQGTFGVFYNETIKLYSCELPWKDNERQKSCIPEGLYECRWHRSPRFGWLYQVQSVPSRGEILIHAGNYCGDVSMGFHSNSHGCILLANKLGYLGKQKAGLMSMIALKAFHSYMNKESFLLEISNAYPASLTSQ